MQPRHLLAGTQHRKYRARRRRPSTPQEKIKRAFDAPKRQETPGESIELTRPEREMEPGRAHRRRLRCSSPRSGQDAPFGSKKFQALAPMPLILNRGIANGFWQTAFSDLSRKFCSFLHLFLSFIGPDQARPEQRQPRSPQDPQEEPRAAHGSHGAEEPTVAEATKTRRAHARRRRARR